MNEYRLHIASIIIVFVMACLLSIGITLESSTFDSFVKNSLRATVGYDMQFIAMVNNLERDLAIRAQFGYRGGTDPMTGKRRAVAPLRTTSVGVRPVSQPEQVAANEPVRLTAIIFDDKTQKHTAILMVDERSFSVETGDKVLDRRVGEILDHVVTMESATRTYRYDLSGEHVEILKN